jgi:hypothetical protein
MNSYELIHALSGSEKRYIRLRISQFVKESTQLKMYERMQEQKEFDRLALQKEFGSNFVLTEQKLYAFLLKSLRQYQEDYSTDFKIRSALGNVEVLFNKGLYGLCQKEIRRALKLANKHQYWQYILAIVDWDIKLDFVLHGNVSVQKIKSDYQQVKSILENIETEFSLQLKSLEARELTMSFLMTANKNTLKRLSKYKYDQKFTTYRSGMFSHFLTTYKYFAFFNTQKRYENYKKAHDIITSSEETLKDNYLYYITSKFNVIVMLIRLGKFNDAEHHLEDFEKSLSIQKLAEIKPYYDMTLERLCFCKIHLQNMKGTFQHALSIKTEEYFDPKISHATNIYYIMSNIQLTYAHFASGHFRAAHKNVISIKENKLLEENSSFYLPVLLLELMVNYELGNHELNDSISRRVYNKTKSQEFMRIFLGLIRKMPLLDSAKLKGNFQAEYKKLIRISQKNLGIKDLIERIDALSWIESKLESKKFIDIYKRRHGV